MRGGWVDWPISVLRMLRAHLNYETNDAPYRCMCRSNHANPIDLIVQRHVSCLRDEVMQLLPHGVLIKLDPATLFGEKERPAPRAGAER